MTTGPDLAALWEGRAEEIARDFARLERLLDAAEVRSWPGVKGRYQFLASPLVEELNNLREQARTQKYGVEAWGRLAALRHRSVDILEDHLEFLGGAQVAAADLIGEFIERVKGWLDGLCDGA